MDQPLIAVVAHRRWPLVALLILAALWLAASALTAAGVLPGQFAAAGASVAAPLALLLLLAALLPALRPPRDVAALAGRVDVAAAAAGALEEQLGRIYSTLVDCHDRVQQLRDSAAADSNGLAASAQALEHGAAQLAGAAGTARDAAADLASALPDAVAQSKTIATTLAEARTGSTEMLAEVQAALAGLGAHLGATGTEAGDLVARLRGLLGDIGTTSADMTKTLASRAYTLDAAVTGVLERASTAFAEIGSTLAARASEVQTLLADGRAQLDSYGAEGARAIGQRLDVLLAAAAQLKQQLQEHQSLSANLEAQSLGTLAAVGERLATLHSRELASAEAIGATAQAQLDMVEARLDASIRRVRDAECEQSAELQQSLAVAEARRAELHQQAADSFAELSAQARALLEAHAAQAQALVAQQQQQSHALAQAADADAESIATRLAALAAQQAEAHAQMQAATDAAAAAIGARFAALTADSDHRLAATSAGLDQLGAALVARQAALQNLGAQVGQLQPDFDAFATHVDARLPMLGNGFELLAHRSEALTSTLDALAERLSTQIELLHDSAAAFERDHDSVAGLAGQLAGEFAAARQAISDIDAHTERTALASASRMVENIVQVRQAVNSAAEEIHSLLQTVVSEAETALDGLAHERADAAFGAPIRLQITALEDASTRAAAAASTAAERLSAQLVDLMRTIAQTEARIDEVDTRMDVRRRDTLAARAQHLIASLQAASVDMTRLLAVDIGDEAWARYLNGDRSLFTRKIVRLGDRDMRRRVQRHYTHDAEFEREAALYLDEFEQLIRRVLKDPDGESFALVLLSSDIGKLYVLISQAIGRNILRSAA